MNGIINVKKEAGMTSHDVVFRLRRLLREKKIGHGGTLDPDVVGVLPIAVGKATRVLEFMTDAGKVYEGRVTLGFSTDTEDASGSLVEQTPVTRPLEEELVDEVMASFQGEIIQTPPMYSAVKVKGRKLYEYARAGEEVERPQRQVTISEFKRTSPLIYENNLCHFSFKVACSKGTYVRTLAVDLGQKLGYASHMSYLERTASAGLQLEDAFTLAAIDKMLTEDDHSFLLPIEYGVAELAKLMISEQEAKELSFGRRIQLPSSEDSLAVFHQEQLVAIVEKCKEGYKPRKVFL
ncbi:tRNA pseudouridine(55) synthase TruB [Streptococcus pseudoporcinus]|uniref:tRNA pseudouridine synthase B n=1 Tax=Streptococcus pseudoporcinus LQ 940-04 TaxID=875093 RepID=G5KC11_9STRE|nr:tRNA pseudouridine(55) synthase TruB [Streptococcus pseudoporcinus]EFR44534.1 tRNA pseudouridine synthase B [Streptococcus pseudoporcinus SPIN 20026]EHI64313.1 tRNA pseudouridine synthase B [Streptococcus pseudoporcinus LQ 940-04]VEF93008.1 tRNA pseudouridine 5S synthase [Streptococcus pseudoporcinus]